jgi:hypothetical protein
MTMQEAEDYIAGQDRRYRQQWEMTRLLAKLIHKVETGKELKLEFPWDNEEEEERPEATPEELAKLNEEAQRMAEYLNRTKR